MENKENKSIIKIGHKKPQFVTDDIRDECLKIVYILYHSLADLRDKFIGSHGGKVYIPEEHDEKKPTAYQQKIFFGETLNGFDHLDQAVSKIIVENKKEIQNYLASKNKIKEGSSDNLF